MKFSVMVVPRRRTVRNVMGGLSLLETDSINRFSSKCAIDSVNSLLIGYFRCEHRKQGHQAHLYLRNLQEIDTIYLEALFLNDWAIISSYERQAQAAGFGPLVPCTVICSAREQKMLCCTQFPLFLLIISLTS